MLDLSDLYLFSSLAKWAQGEELSRPDLERVLAHLERSDLKISTVDPAGVAAYQARLRSVMLKKYASGGGQ